MKKRFVSTHGFTIVELLIVIVIVSILALIATPIFLNSYTKNELTSAIWDVSDQLRRAQLQSMLGQGNNQWGVHFQSDRFVLFKGGTYNASDPDNIEELFEPNITMSAHSLNGGGDDVIFDKIFGATSTFGTITLQEGTGGQQQTITVNEVGRVSY